MGKFLKEPAFRWITGLGAVATVTVAAVSIGVSGVNGCTGQVKCITTFMELMGPAIKVLEVSMAILVFYTILHRIQQTENQMKALNDTNTFRDYISHRAAFNEFLSGLKDNDLKVSDPAGLYALIFPENSPRNFNPSIGQVIGGQSYESLFSEYKTLCKELQIDVVRNKMFTKIPRLELIAHAMKIYTIAERLGISNTFEVSIVSDGKQVRTNQILGVKYSAERLFSFSADVFDRIGWFCGRSEELYSGVFIRGFDEALDDHNIIKK